MRVLPDWLAHPSVVTDDIRNRKKALDEVSGLDDEMKEKLRENGIHSLFPGKIFSYYTISRIHIIASQVDTNLIFK